MANEIQELTIKPRGERRLKPRWVNKSVEFETGKIQVHGISTAPTYFWELKFTGTMDVGNALEDFFNEHCGSRKAFYWTDGKGVRRTVRFAQDELDMTEKWGFTENGYEPVAFDCTVMLREVS